MRKEYYFVLAWLQFLAGLAALGWIFSVGMSELNSYRTFGALGVWGSMVFVGMWLCGKGVRYTK